MYYFFNILQKVRIFGKVMRLIVVFNYYVKRYFMGQIFHIFTPSICSKHLGTAHFSHGSHKFSLKREK
jgi:hypothetical protein